MSLKSSNKTKCFISKILLYLQKHDGDRFCLNCFYNFQTDEKLKQHLKSCINHNHSELEIPGKFKTVLNKETDQKATNVWKYIQAFNSK